MDKRSGEKMILRHFYIRRFSRIAPLFYLLMLLYWIRDAAVFGVFHPLSEVLVNASLLFNLVPSCIAGFVWASWAIGVITVLYLIFPVIHRYVLTFMERWLYLYFHSDRVELVVFCQILRCDNGIPESG